MISKPVWYAMAFVLIGLFAFLIFGDYDMEFGLISEASMDKLNQLQLNLLEKLPSANISNIYVYAFIGLAFFVGVQVYLLRNHFEKRYYLD